MYSYPKPVRDSHTLRAGFTLIEVLLALAVLGILAVLATPSYQKYVNEARAAEFLVKMHEITLAYHDVFATTDNLAAWHDEPGYHENARAVAKHIFKTL